MPTTHPVPDVEVARLRHAAVGVRRGQERGRPATSSGVPMTGGARKVRVAGRGKGRSGGFRVISYYAGEDLPVFLITVFSKGERADLSAAERVEIRRELAGLADEYRKARRKWARRRRRS